MHRRFVVWSILWFVSSGCTWRRPGAAEQPPPIAPPEPREGFVMLGSVLRDDSRDSSMFRHPQPCIGCEVRMVPAESDGVATDRIGTTDRWGRYRLTNVPQALYHLVVSSPDGWWGAGRRDLGSTGVAGESNGEDVTVRNGGLLAIGIVRDALTHRPIARARVTLGRNELVRDVMPYVPDVHSGDDGSYRIGGIVPIQRFAEPEEIRLCASIGERRTCAMLPGTVLPPGEMRTANTDLELPR